MADLLWCFLVYSFLGFLLEVAYARLLHAEKRDRKCFLLLPLCPVYGLGAVFILLLPAAVQSRPVLLLPLGAAAATAAEYGTGLFYEKAAGVKFWDYSHLPGNRGGRICPLYSGFWGVLALFLVYLLHPAIASLTRTIPDFLLLPALLLLGADGFLTIWLLRREGDTGVLRWYRRKHRAAVQETKAAAASRRLDV